MDQYNRKLATISTKPEQSKRYYLKIDSKDVFSENNGDQIMTSADTARAQTTNKIGIRQRPTTQSDVEGEVVLQSESFT